MEYLIGNVDDPHNWGDKRTTRGGLWSALEKVIAPAYRNQFIFLQHFLTEDPLKISMYLHEATGTTILVDDHGQTYDWLGNGMGLIPISVQEARTRLVAALLDASDKELERGVPLHEREINHYRPLPKRSYLMSGSHSFGDTKQSK